MGETVRSRTLDFQRHRQPSPYRRLAEEWGLAREKTARDQLSHAYRRVAIANRVLLEAGQSEKVGELMAVIEASLMGEPQEPDEAQHIADLKDAMEDVAQVEWIKTHSNAALEAYIKSLASDILCAEKLLAALIAEKQRRKEAGES